VGIRGHILVLFPVAVVAVGCSLLETKDECIRRCNSNADEVFSRLEHVCKTKLPYDNIPEEILSNFIYQRAKSLRFMRQEINRARVKCLKQRCNSTTDPKQRFWQNRRLPC
jgi:hypothetical protein